MEQLDRDLDGLLAQYRGDIGEPEASVNFMPRLWQKIEAKRNLTFKFRRLTQLFVGTAAAICLLIAGVSTALPPGRASQPHGSYLDVLAEAVPADTLAAQGIRVESEDGVR